MLCQQQNSVAAINQHKRKECYIYTFSSLCSADIKQRTRDRIYVTFVIKEGRYCITYQWKQYFT